MNIGKRNIFALIMVLSFILLLWYPFGITALGGLIEEWDNYFMLERWGGWWGILRSQSVDQFVSRPLAFLLYAISHIFDPNSFDGMNYFLVISFIIKGICGYYTGLYIFKQKYYGLISGILFVVCPVDTQILALRTTTISFAYTFSFVGIISFLYFVDSTLKIKTILLGFLSGVSFVIANLMYEGVFFNYIFVLLIFLIPHSFLEFITILRKNWKRIALWCTAPMFSFFYIYWSVFLQPMTYQQSLLVGTEGVWHVFLINVKYFFTFGLYRVFFDTWQQAYFILCSLVYDYSYILFILIYSIVLLGFFFEKAGKWPYFFMVKSIFLSLLMLFVGYISILLSSHYYITQRTFFGVVPPFSILVIIFFHVFDSKKYLSSVMYGLFITLCCVSLLYQHDVYARNKIDTENYLFAIIEKLDLSKNVHIIFDKSGFENQLLGGAAGRIPNGIPVMLKRQDQFFRMIDSISYPYEDITYKQAFQAFLPVSKEAELVEITDVRPQGGGDEKIKWRSTSRFDVKKSMFLPQVAGHSLRFVADSMWGFLAFLRGSGWVYFTDFSKMGDYHSVAYTEKGKGNWLIELSPLNATYIVSLTGKNIQNLQMQINGVGLKDAENTPGSIRWHVPAGIFQAGMNEIVVSNDGPLMVRRLDIYPADKAAES